MYLFFALAILISKGDSEVEGADADADADSGTGTGLTAGAIISAIPAVGAGGAGGTEPLLSPTLSSEPSPRLINTSLRGLLIRKVYTSSHY
jgi:hypothetical protein